MKPFCYANMYTKQNVYKIIVSKNVNLFKNHPRSNIHTH